MTAQLADLIAQKVALERQIKEVQAAAKADALAKVRDLMARYGLTVADLADAPPKKNVLGAVSKVAPKYRDPVTGATWSGRGLKPRWLATALESGKTLSDFAI